MDVVDYDTIVIKAAGMRCIYDGLHIDCTPYLHCDRVVRWV